MQLERVLHPLLLQRGPPRRGDPAWKRGRRSGLRPNKGTKRQNYRTAAVHERSRGIRGSPLPTPEPAAVRSSQPSTRFHRLAEEPAYSCQDSRPTPTNGVLRGLLNREDWFEKWEDYMYQPQLKFQPNFDNFSGYIWSDYTAAQC